MRASIAFVLVLSALGLGAEAVIENDRLAVGIDPDAGELSVADKLAGELPSQVLPPQEPGPMKHREYLDAFHPLAIDDPVVALDELANLGFHDLGDHPAGFGEVRQSIHGNSQPPHERKGGPRSVAGDESADLTEVVLCLGRPDNPNPRH